MIFTGDIPDVKTVIVPVRDTTNGHWVFPDKMGEKDKVGFIYVIRDVYFNRHYLGKKMFRGTGKLNKGKESNWKKYSSSSKLLVEVMSTRPREEFEFICIEEYQTKGTLSYSETWSLCLVEAPTSLEWYNTLIEKVSWNVKEKITNRHKDRLSMVLENKPIKDFYD
jgi:hypothetical protein